MGDEILKTYMRIFFLMAISFSVNFAKNETSPLDDTKGYDQIFNKIAETRVGITNDFIDTLANPFNSSISDENNQSQEVNRPDYVLKAIIAKRAKINNAWYNINEQVGDYTLTSILDNHVILQNSTEKKSLYIRKKNDSQVKISFK